MVLSLLLGNVDDNDNDNDNDNIHYLSSWTNLALFGIRNRDLCETGAMLHQMTYHASWELIMFWVRNIPVYFEESNWIYERLHTYIFSLRR